MRHARRRTPLGVIIATVLATAALPAVAAGLPPGQAKDSTIELPQLNGPARILRDADGMPHIYAQDEHDAVFLQGWVTAQDRLFQIDVVRRQASGTLAALVGSGALASDVELQVIGLRRAAQRSLAALSPESVSVLDAYAAGVNAWIAANPLPSEYTALELTKAKVPAWTALDSVAASKLLAFGLAVDLDDIANT
jgi:penicillin amidase